MNQLVDRLQQREGRASADRSRHESARRQDRVRLPANAQRGTSRPDGKPYSDREQGNGVPPALFEMVYTEVVDRLDTGGVQQLDPDELSDKVVALVDDALATRRIALPPARKRELVGSIGDEILGLGPLEPLLADPTVSDILVNGSQQVFVEREGVLCATGVRFRDDKHLLNTINRIVARIGRRIDEASPMVDARLPDGSRINAVIPPITLDGPTLSIRRFGGGPARMKDLVAGDALSVNMAHYLRSAVRSRCNILVCGGTGSGKTTLLNAISSYISSRERVITIEDSAELQLHQQHVVRMETRPPNIEGRGEVRIRDLVRNALRMRPDRIVIGEVRADEVLDMVQAMNTGHEGSMTTIHANSVDDAFTRLMTMLSMATSQLSEAMMLQMIARAIHAVVHVVRDSTGKRRLAHVAEVRGVSNGQVCLHEVFSLDAKRSRHKGRWRCSSESLLQQRFAAAGEALDPRVLGATASGSRER